jgi:hypothetical protein
VIIQLYLPLLNCVLVRLNSVIDAMKVHVVGFEVNCLHLLLAGLP